jgi:hypothetical protein
MDMDIKKLTKAELIAIVNTQSAEIVDLRAKNSALQVQLEAAQPQCAPDIAQRYPLVDGRGRRYRITNVRGMPAKAYAPEC